MNIYEKIQQARVELQKSGLKKVGIINLQVLIILN